MGYQLCLLLLLLLLSRLPAQPAASAVIEGDVVNATTEAPLAGVWIKLDGGGEPLFLKTDAKGHFIAANLTPEIYNLSTRHPGFLPVPFTYLDLTPKNGDRLRATIRPTRISPPKIERSIGSDGSVHVSVTIPLVAQAIIAGKVTDPDGQPLQDCPIELRLRTPADPKLRPGVLATHLEGTPYDLQHVNSNYRTDDCGEFRVSQLEPGAYYLIVNKSRTIPGQNDLHVTYFPNALSIESAKPIEVAAGEHARADIQVMRLSGVRVSGRITNPDAPGIPANHHLYTNVMLVPEKNILSNSNGPFTISKGGEYQLKDVLPGRYNLMALTRDATSDPTGQNQKALFALLRPVEVPAQDTTLDLVMQPLRDLPGIVSFADGCAATTVHIAARVDAPSLDAGQAETDSGPDGTFVLQGLTVGTYKVAVTRSAKDQMPLRVNSIKLSDREIRDTGFASPLSTDGPLRIEIGCTVRRRPQ